MEVVMQMMYSYSLELLAAAVGLMLLLELVTLRKINKWKKKEKEQFFELEETLRCFPENLTILYPFAIIAPVTNP